MINEQLLQPKSIVVIGGSNNVHKPGGSIVRNLISGDYQGELRIVNPKEDIIQGQKALCRERRQGIRHHLCRIRRGDESRGGTRAAHPRHL